MNFGRSLRKKRADAGQRRKIESEGDVMISFRMHPDRDAEAIAIYEALRKQGYSKRDIFVPPLLQSQGIVAPTGMDSVDVVNRLNTLLNQVSTLIGDRFEDIKEAVPVKKQSVGSLNKKQRGLLENMLSGFYNDDTDEE